MVQTIRFSKKIGEVSASFDVSIPYFMDINNQLRFKNKAADLKDVADLKVLFDPNRDKYLNPKFRTTFITQDNKLYIGKIKVGLNVLVADVPYSNFTVEDKRILNIIERGKGGRIIVVTFSPHIAIVHSAYLQITVEITNPETPNSKAMPHGHKVFLETYVGLPNIADKDIVFGNGVNLSSEIGRAHV